MLQKEFARIRKNYVAKVHESGIKKVCQSKKKKT